MTTEYDSAAIRSVLDAGDAAQSARERGRALERLARYLFERCPGVRHYASNVFNLPGSSEVDVSFWNERRSSSLSFLPEMLIVECKNDLKPVGSAAVRVFHSKLCEMRLTHGVLVASAGVTGNPQNLRAAHDVVRSVFQREERYILVVTRAEIEALRTSAGLVTLLQDKIMRLTLQAATFR